MTSTLTPYRPAGSPGRDGFAQILHAEWTKFRTINGWLIAVVAAAALTALLPIAIAGTAGNPVESCHAGNCQVEGSVVATGPGGEAVVDQFYFVHQAMEGNGSITALVTAPHGVAPKPHAPLDLRLPATQPWAKAGVMIKESTKAGSAYAAVALTGGHGVRMQYDYTHDIAGSDGKTTPLWLRLTRRGNVITGYESAGGTHWSAIGTAVLPKLTTVVQAGLFVASPDYTELASGFGGGDDSNNGPTWSASSFTHVALTTGAAKWTGTAVAPPGATQQNIIFPIGPHQQKCGVTGTCPGKQGFSQAGGTFRVTGSGDIAPFTPIVDPLQVCLFGVLFGLIALIAIGVVYITAEYRRGMIRTTLTASPRRGRILAAKAIVIGTVGFAAGLIGTVIAFIVVERKLNKLGWMPPVWHILSATSSIGLQVIIGTAAIVALTGVLALAAGVITRRSAGAVAAVIGLVIVPLVLGIVLPLAPARLVLMITPAAAFSVQQIYPRYSQVSTTCAPYHGCFPLAPWTGFAVMCAWVAAALITAAWLLRRRDA
ncbi:MAG TPA: ABC transporter permease subunit [Streptosporangiaceae bacterium]|nr:ABC transporter permease subunit [Streptosporangiaceae bacterium]